MKPLASVGQAPLSFALPGQDIYLGKEFSDATAAQQSNAPITELFDVPSEGPEALVVDVLARSRGARHARDLLL